MSIIIYEGKRNILTQISVLDNLEQQCEDALFKLCDARERYPLRCSNQLKESIQLNSDMHVIIILNKCIILSYLTFLLNILYTILSDSLSYTFFIQ